MCSHEYKLAIITAPNESLVVNLKATSAVPESAVPCESSIVHLA